MSVVRAQEKEYDGNAEQEFLGRCILCAVVDLLPHIQVIIGATVEIERYATNVVKHNVRAEHVGYVCQGPGSFLRDTRDHIPENLQRDN